MKEKQANIDRFLHEAPQICIDIRMATIGTISWTSLGNLLYDDLTFLESFKL